MKRSYEETTLSTTDSTAPETKLLKYHGSHNKKKRPKEITKTLFDLPDDVIYCTFEYLTSTDWVNMIMKASNKSVYLWSKNPYFIKAITWKIGTVPTLHRVFNDENKEDCENILQNIEKMILGDSDFARDPYLASRVYAGYDKLIGDVIVMYCLNLKHLTLSNCSMDVRLERVNCDIENKLMKMERSLLSLKLENASLKLPKKSLYAYRDTTTHHTDNDDFFFPSVTRLYSDIFSVDSIMSLFFTGAKKQRNPQQKMDIYMEPINRNQIQLIKPRLWMSFLENIDKLSKCERIGIIYLDPSYMDFHELIPEIRHKHTEFTEKYRDDWRYVTMSMAPIDCIWQEIWNIEILDK